MRTMTLVALAAVAGAPLLALACGSGSKSNPMTPPNPSVAAGSGSTAPPEPGAGGADEQQHASVTTDTLGDGGDQSTRLAPAPVGSMVTDAGVMMPVGDAGSGRSIDDLKAAVLAHRDQARACYDAGLKDHAGVQGDLIVHFVIDPQGKVIDAQLGPNSTLTEPTIVSCVLDVIKKITFAANPTGRNSIVNYPFNFKPRG